MRRRMAAVVAAFGRRLEMTAVVQRFTQLRREETASVASALCFFFILTALIVLRPAREALGMRLRGTSSDDW